MSDDEPFGDLWRRSFVPIDSRIDDKFFRDLIGMYRARAQLYHLISYVLLISTMVVVMVGVYTFIRGDTRDEILATSEVELIGRIQKQQDDINKIALEAAGTNESASVWRRVRTLATVLFRSKTGLNALARDPTKSLLASNVSVNKASLNILERLGKQESETSTVLVLPQEFDSESNSFPAAAFALLNEGATSASVDTKLLSKELKEIVELLDSVAAKVSAVSNEKLSAEDAMTIKRRVDAAAQLSKMDELFSLIDDRTRKAEESDQALRASLSSREAQKQSLERGKENLQRELTTVREQREKILFMSWIPGLTLRVGTVILLLFLTQIMLSTYRYTLGVAGFYLARSDAVQLLQSATESSNRYLSEQLITLMEALTPSRYQVDPVKDPTDQLSDLAKSWIARFKP